jgi:hypothetical protein
VELQLVPGLATDREPLDVRLAKRVLTRQGGAVIDVDGTLTARLPAEVI